MLNLIQDGVVQVALGRKAVEVRNQPVQHVTKYLNTITKQDLHKVTNTLAYMCDYSKKQMKTYKPNRHLQRSTIMQGFFGIFQSNLKGLAS